MRKCLLCDKEFIERAIGSSREKKYCSERCGSIFRTRKLYANGKKLLLKDTNPTLYKKLIKDNYEKNKDIWHSRSCTKQFFDQISNLNKLLPIKCNKCQSSIDLEIHHEVYPTSHSKIIEAILDGKIYFLCKTCHSNLNRKL